MLVDNYRSTQPILDTAARLVSYNNPYRLEAIAGIDKRLRSPRERRPPRPHFHFDTVSAEADGVAALIEERVRAGLAGRATWRSWCAATPTPTRSCARST